MKNPFCASPERAVRLIAVIALLSGLGLRAEAQQQPQVGATSDNTGLQEVVVTAQKREENSQKVPIAVSTMTGEELRASGIISSTELNLVDTSLQIQYEAASLETRIRGVGTISNGPGVENPVALYVDGVYYASQLMGGQPLDNVAQVSVLKGPQGTLFGRNATGGVIQIGTRDPSRTSEFQITTDLDQYLTSRSDLYVTGGIGGDNAANLFLSFATQGTGWGTNLLTGQDNVHQIDHDFNGRTKWFFALGSDTTLKLNLDYRDRADTMGLNIIPAPGTDAYTLLPGFTRTSHAWDTDIWTTATNDIQSGGASATLESGLSFARLQSITAWRAFDFVDHFSSTASPYPGVVIDVGGTPTLLPGEDLYIKQKGEEITQELQLLSLTSSKITWSGGLYYFYNSEKSPATEINLLAPPGVIIVPIVVNSRTITNSIAAYGQATIPLSWLGNSNLTLGARETYEHRSFQGNETVGGAPVPLPPINPTITANRPTWRVALDHSFTPDVLGYVSFNTGFKSGGYNGYDPTNPPYHPETVEAYEMGFKSESFNHALRLNGAVFYYDYSNIQVSRYTDTAVIYNGAKAEIYGAELDAEAKMGNLLLGVGGTYLHTEFTSFPEAACSEPNYPAPGITQFSCSATGNRLPYAPTFTGKLTADYLVPVGSGNLDFNVTEYYNGGYFAEPDNFLKQNAYSMLNASVTFRGRNDKYSIQIYGTNLLNKAVPAFLGTNATQYSADYEYPPMLYGIHLMYRF